MWSSRRFVEEDLRLLKRRQIMHSVRVLHVLRGHFACAILLAASSSAVGQPLERLTFQEAIDRATKNNPTVARATEGILRAEAILQQTRSSSLPTLNASVATNF